MQTRQNYIAPTQAEYYSNGRDNKLADLVGIEVRTKRKQLFDSVFKAVLRYDVQAEWLEEPKQVPLRLKEIDKLIAAIQATEKSMDAIHPSTKFELIRLGFDHDISKTIFNRITCATNLDLKLTSNRPIGNIDAFSDYRRYNQALLKALVETRKSVLKLSKRGRTKGLALSTLIDRLFLIFESFNPTKSKNNYKDPRHHKTKAKFVMTALENTHIPFFYRSIKSDSKLVVLARKHTQEYLYRITKKRSK